MGVCTKVIEPKVSPNLIPRSQKPLNGLFAAYGPPLVPSVCVPLALDRLTPIFKDRGMRSSRARICELRWVQLHSAQPREYPLPRSHSSMSELRKQLQLVQTA